MCKENMRHRNDQRLLGLCQKEQEASLKEPSLTKIWKCHKYDNSNTYKEKVLAFLMCEGFYQIKHI